MFRTGSRRIIANVLTANTIVKREDGYHVVSESGGKNLGGPYKSRGEAEKRLAQVEYFKHTNNVVPARAQGYEAVRDSAGSGTNPYPTRPPMEPETDPAPLAEWESPPNGPGQALRPASRYQQPWAYQDVGQGKQRGRMRPTPNRGPLGF